MINMMVSLKIAQYYPDYIAVVPIYDEDRRLYSAAIFSYIREEQSLGETLYSLDNYIYRTEGSAVHELKRQLDMAMAAVKVMSN